jgi:hypothetical protein
VEKDGKVRFGRQAGNVPLALRPHLVSKGREQDQARRQHYQAKNHQKNPANNFKNQK